MGACPNIKPSAYFDGMDTDDDNKDNSHKSEDDSGIGSKREVNFQILIEWILLN